MSPQKPQNYEFHRTLEKNYGQEGFSRIWVKSWQMGLFQNSNLIAWTRQAKGPIFLQNKSPMSLVQPRQLYSSMILSPHSTLNPHARSQNEMLTIPSPCTYQSTCYFPPACCFVCMQINYFVKITILLRSLSKITTNEDDYQ